MKQNRQKRIGMVILASVIGTVLLLAGLFIIITINNEQAKIVNQLYPTAEKDGSPAGVGFAILAILIFVISSLFTGIFVNILINKSLMALSLKKRLINDTLYSIISGLLSGIFVWISYVIYSALYGDPAEIIRTPPFFIIIAVLIAVLSMFGGVCFSLVYFTIRRGKPI